MKIGVDTGDNEPSKVFDVHQFSSTQGIYFSILDDPKCGFSLSSFIRQATTVRKMWLGEVCVRGRLCVPPRHWNRNIFLQPLSDNEAPENLCRDFDSGRPWLFANIVH